MAKKKGTRVVITLEHRSDMGTYRYTTQKNKRNSPNRLEMRKYCPLTKRHEIFKAIK